MAYVNVPKDLTKVKTKVLFNLTKRQLVWPFQALIGVPLFFLLKHRQSAPARRHGDDGDDPGHAVRHV